MAHDGPMFCQLTKFPDMSSLQTKQQKQMSPWTFLRVPWTIPDIHRYKWRWNSCHCKWYTNFHSCYITEIESIFNLFLDIFFVTMRGSIFHETGVCLIYKDAWYLNNLRRFLSSTPISWNGSSSKSGTCVALRWNSTGGPLVCNQTARGPAQWETQPFETNCWLASDVSFFHHQTFLGGKAFGYKEMWTKGHESLIISEKNTSWHRVMNISFYCIGTLFQVEEFWYKIRHGGHSQTQKNHLHQVPPKFFRHWACWWR